MNKNAFLKLTPKHVQGIFTSRFSEDYPMTSRFPEEYRKMKSLFRVGVCCIASLLSFFAAAQNKPGNTPLTTEIWLAADEMLPLPGNAAAVTTWNDLSGNNRHFIQATTARQAAFNSATGLMNYRPSVKFGGDDRYPATFATVAGKGYYVFYVSISNNAAAQATVYNFKSNTGFKSGWMAGNPSYNTVTSGSTAPLQFTPQTAPAKTYGIVGIYRPNSASFDESISFNGESRTLSVGRPITVSSAVSVIGSNSATSSTSGNLPFTGEIQEIIVLSDPSPGIVNTDAVSKINTYLALKYGITLVNTQNYINSIGETVWAADATYGHGIFGIGRDDASGFNQRQATSYDDPTLTLFVGSITNLNKLNTTPIGNNNSYTIIGHNGVPDGFVGYNPGVNNINSRQNRIFKVQNTMTQQVSIKTDCFARAEYLMVSTSENFEPANTTYTKIVDGIANVTLSIGSRYIGIAFQNQTPGGLPNIKTELWLSADDVSGTLPANGASVTGWRDLSINYMNFEKYSTHAVPVMNYYEGMNFHPAIHFKSSLLQFAKLASKANFQLDKNRSYYTFWVSEFEGGDPQASVFSFGTGTGTTNTTPRNDVGWNDGGLLRTAVQGVDHVLTATSTKYGIGGSFVPNSGSSPQVQSFNGTPTTLSANAAMYATSYIASQAVLGNSNLLTNAANSNFFYGKIHEVIVLSADNNAAYSLDYLTRVNSYLAIKYGQTLATGNYLDSDGYPVWTRDANYEKAIFGLARDDASRLHQKQATSYDSKTVTVYLGNLQGLNRDNTNDDLADKTYLMFSSNEKTGWVQYPQSPQTNYLEGTNFGAINHRQQRVLKVQSSDNILATGLQVNMRLHLNADYVLVSADENFAPGNTRIYNVTDYIATNVTVKNGEYVGFAFFSPTPGAVNSAVYNIELWLKADKVGETLPANGSRVTTWSDAAPFVRNFVTNGNDPAPLMSYAGMNYHPAVEFRQSLGTLTKLVSQDNFPLSKTKAYFTFWVSQFAGTTRASVFSFGSTGTGNTSTETTTNPRNDVGWAATGASRYSVRSYDHPATLSAKYGIGASLVLNGSTTQIQQQYFNGRKTDVTGNNAYRMFGGTTTNGENTIYAPSKAVLGNSTDEDDDYFYGKTQEVIVLTRDANTQITDTALRVVSSYLAIKYGVSLDTTSLGQSDYRRSDDTIVWKGSDNSGYRSSIFGIGRDDATGLYQKQGKSADANNGPTVFVGPDLTTLNSQNTGTLFDKSYLLIGSNGRSDFIQVSIAKDSAYVNAAVGDSLNVASGAVYKAQLTDTASIAVGFLTPLTDFRYVFVSANNRFEPDSTFIYPFANVNSRRIAQGVVIDTIYRYITFAGYEAGPGGVNKGLRLWLRADDEFSVITEDLLSTDSKLLNYPAEDLKLVENKDAVPAVTKWTDLVRGHTYSYANGATTGTAGAAHRIPVLQKNNLMTNYHPAVKFWGSGTTAYGTYLSNTDTNIMPNPPVDGKHTAYFLVNNNFSNNAWAYILTFGNETLGTIPQPGYGVQKIENTPYLGNITGRFRSSDGAEETRGTKNLFTIGATSILGYQTRTANSGRNNLAYFRFNGKEDNTANATSPGNPMFNWSNIHFNEPSMLGPGWNYERTIRGVMSEVILYDRQLDETELRYLESYMAIKYGVTLRPTSTPTERFDYQFSTGNIFWKGNSTTDDTINYPHLRKFVKFYNNIAAVIKDNAALLDNRQAHSTDVGSIVHIGLAGRDLDFNGDSEVEDVLNDGEAIVWGNDGDSSDVTVLDSDCGTFDYKFNRKWLIHKVTEGNRPVRLLVSAQDNSATFGTADAHAGYYYQNLGYGNDVFMIVAASPDSLTFGPYRAVVRMPYVNGEHQCNYIFTDEDTYITFGYTENNNGCVPDSLTFTGTKKFLWTDWTRATNTHATNSTGFTVSKVPTIAGDLGDDIKVLNTSVAYPSPIRSIRGYPQVVTTPERGSLYVRRTHGNVGDPVTITIEFNTPVIPEFTLSDLDGSQNSYEEVTVEGTCAIGGSGTSRPTLTYATDPRLSTYVITGNTATVKARSGTMTATNKRGMVNVKFNGGVTTVTIQFIMRNRMRTGSIANRLYISPITLRPVPPAPPINEDGLSFVKHVADDSITTCEPVKYSFFISNVNCDSMYVNFADTLPENMFWKDLMLDPVNSANEDINVHDFLGKRELVIDSLIVRGESQTVRIDATAVMAADAPTGDYDNRAIIDYSRLVNGVPEDTTLWSLDDLTLGTYTSFYSEWTQRLDSAKMDIQTDKKMYIAGDSITFTYTLLNPNDFDFTGMFLNISYNEEFKYKGDFTFSGAPAAALINEDPDDPSFFIAGNDPVDPTDPDDPLLGFTLPAGVPVVFSFTFKAPSSIANLALDYDENGDPIPGKYTDLIVYHELTTEMEDACVIEAISELYGETHIPYPTIKRISTIIETPVKVDSRIEGKTCPTPAPTLDDGEAPHHGTAIFEYDSLIYTPSDGFTGRDTLIYYITCSETKYAVVVYIIVYERPDNISDEDCYVTPQAAEWSFGELPINYAAQVHNYGPLTVGDIDDDDTVEIIGYTATAATANNFESPGITIFTVKNDRVQVKNSFLFSATGGSTAPTFGAMAIARYKNRGYIIVAGTDRYLYAYSPTGARLWRSSAVYDATVIGTVMGIVDFNADSIPEVYVGNKIFSLDNGVLLCDGGTSNNRGVLLSSVGFSTHAADMDGDGLPELVAGTQIYKVNIASPLAASASNTVTVMDDWKLTAALPTYATADGATQIADVDNDGKLEVVVLSCTGSRVVAYVWKPLPNNASYVMGSYLVPATSASYYSIPMIGDIDNEDHKNFLEIVFITTGSVNNMYALKCDTTAARGSQISIKWTLGHTDTSGCTGMTLFDFNQDGHNEIVYRDETQLRIINGRGSGTPSVYKTFQYVASGTLREFPIVADLDNDGHAEIVVAGEDIFHWGSIGILRVFKSTGTPWAPARSVWNQYAYNAVNVNEDLTIPVYQLNPAMRFAGPDHVLDTDDDVRPYNSFMQQQTTLDKYGLPLMLTPDATPIYLTSTSSYVDSIVNITLNISNIGDAGIGPKIYVSLYKNSTTGTVLKTDSFDISIAQGNSAVVSTSYVDTSALNNPYVVLARVNDKYPKFAYWAECDSSNNVVNLGLMTKAAVLNSVPHIGRNSNPVSVLYNEEIEYTLRVANPSTSRQSVIIRDSLPAYLNLVPGSALPEPDLSLPVDPERHYLMWDSANVLPNEVVVVRYRATPAQGSVASQPLFPNRALVTTYELGSPKLTYTNYTYHQGAGVALVIFSASLGGSIIGETTQAVDYRSTAVPGVIVVPDPGYVFVGWKHEAYTSMRGEIIPAVSGIMQYDELIIHGNVELHAVFESAKTFSTANSAIEENPTEDNIWSSESTLFVKTQKSGSIVRIYTVSGTLFDQRTILVEGTTPIKLPQGLYVVTLNNSTGTKIAIK